MQQPKVIISGGGTGGHIFPAIAIANALKQIIPSVEILFVGAEGKMEMEKVPAAGYHIESLWISGFQRSLSAQNLLLPFKIISSYLKARKILKSFKPQVVIGTGGYASWAVMKAAGSMNIPTVIQEQNSFPGKSNLNLAGTASLICVAYPGMEKFFPKDKIRLTGNPVRQDIQNLQGKKDRALELFGLDAGKKTVLVIGGSLGARTINESVALLVQRFKEENIQLIWQTGKGFSTTAKELTKGLEKNGIVSFDFIQKMDYAYAAADVVVSRAGAISISELCLVHKPSILIPSPNVAEDHQTKNAMALSNVQAALMVKDSEAKSTLGEVLFPLIKNEDLQIKLRNNIAALSFNDAASAIASEIIKLFR